MRTHHQGLGWRIGFDCRLITWFALKSGRFLSWPALWAAGWLSFFAPALAATEIEDLYKTGRFAEVVSLGIEDGSAPALALGARACLAAAQFAETDERRNALIEKGLGLAKQALRLDGNNVEAHLQAAVALGLQGRVAKPVEAHMRGAGDKTKHHIDAALKQAPGDPWAHAALGAWHLEIVSGGGSAAARLFYGAKEKSGLDAFDRAISLAPDNIILRYERALAFVAFDQARLRAAAAADLAHVGDLEPSNYLDAELQKRAHNLAVVLAQGDDKAIAEKVAELRWEN